MHVVDFVCLDRQLIVEVDGVQHGFEQNREREQRRTRFLEAAGYRVFRVWNGEIRENVIGVCDSLVSELEDAPARLRSRRHPNAPPQDKGGGA